MIRTHVAAVVAALDAVPNLAVYDGEVPDNATLPYVVVYPDQGAAQSSTLVGTSDVRTFRVQTTSVGGDAAQARWAAEKAQGALLDVVLTVTDRTCFPVRLDTSRPMLRDDDVAPAVHYCVDVWRLSTVPA